MRQRHATLHLLHCAANVKCQLPPTNNETKKQPSRSFYLPKWPRDQIRQVGGKCGYSTKKSSRNNKSRNGPPQKLSLSQHCDFTFRIQVKCLLAYLTLSQDFKSGLKYAS